MKVRGAIGAFGIAADALVERKDMQDLQVLALVLVDPLDQHVEHGLGIGGHAQPVVDIRRELELIVALDGAPLVAEVRVVGQRLEAAQFFEVVDPSLAEPRGKQLREARIAEHHPAPRGDAVGLVGELLRRERVEVAQHAGFEQARCAARRRR